MRGIHYNLTGMFFFVKNCFPSFTVSVPLKVSRWG
jgi:hypothetical protein